MSYRERVWPPEDKKKFSLADIWSSVRRPSGAKPRNWGAILFLVLSGLVGLFIFLQIQNDALLNTAAPKKASPDARAVGAGASQADAKQIEDQLRASNASVTNAIDQVRTAKQDIQNGNGTGLVYENQANLQQGNQQQPQRALTPTEYAETLKIMRQKQALEVELIRLRSPMQPSGTQKYSEIMRPDEPEKKQPPEPAKQAVVAEVEKPPAPPKYVIKEGIVVRSILQNRLNSTFTGPVKVMTSHPVLSRDRMHVLIPASTIILGEAQRVTDFGQDRVGIVFHKIQREDNVDIDLDKFTGLNQIGETGVDGKTDHHYLSTFGIATALGVLGAASSATASYGYEESGADYMRRGFSVGMSQAAMTVLNKFLNRPPKTIIAEGTRVDVYFMKDIELPLLKDKEVQ